MRAYTPIKPCQPIDKYTYRGILYAERRRSHASAPILGPFKDVRSRIDYFAHQRVSFFTPVSVPTPTMTRALLLLPRLDRTEVERGQAGCGACPASRPVRRVYKPKLVHRAVRKKQQQRQWRQPSRQEWSPASSLYGCTTTTQPGGEGSGLLHCSNDPHCRRRTPLSPPSVLLSPAARARGFHPRSNSRESNTKLEPGAVRKEELKKGRDEAKNK